MNTEQIRLLTKMKRLVNNGYRKFEDRPDRNYMDDLAELNITIDEVWKYILSLNSNFYFIDPKQNYNKDGKSLLFKRDIKGVLAYIKLRIEMDDNKEMTVCISFHKDKNGRR